MWNKRRLEQSIKEWGSFQVVSKREKKKSFSSQILFLQLQVPLRTPLWGKPHDRETRSWGTSVLSYRSPQQLCFFRWRSSNRKPPSLRWLSLSTRSSPSVVLRTRCSNRCGIISSSSGERRRRRRQSFKMQISAILSIMAVCYSCWLCWSRG